MLYPHVDSADDYDTVAVAVAAAATAFDDSRFYVTIASDVSDGYVIVYILWMAFQCRNVRDVFDFRKMAVWFVLASICVPMFLNIFHI